MLLEIRPLHPDFVGEVVRHRSDPAALPDAVAAIDAGMDRYAVLVFHDQHFDDASQLAFSRNFGDLEISSGGEMSKPEERRLAIELADISNLDRDSRLRAADDKARSNALGNRLWHSDASFRADPGEILAAFRPRRAGKPAATPNSPTCAPPMTRWTTRPKRRSRTWSPNTPVRFRVSRSAFRRWTSATTTRTSCARCAIGWCARIR